MTLLETNTASPHGPIHLGELTLRRFFAGELLTERSAEVEQHLSSCPLCRNKLRSLAEEQREFEREIPFERFAGGVERARRVPRSRPRSLWSFGLAGVLAAAAVAVFFVRGPSQPRNVAKGANVEVTARIASANGPSQRIAPPGSHEILDAGDRVRLGYKTADGRYLAALSVDERGEVTPVYPEAGPALPIAATLETVYLPDSIEFTGNGREKLFLFVARKPFQLEEARQAVAASFQASKGDLDALQSPAFAGGQDVFAWVFKKP